MEEVTHGDHTFCISEDRKALTILDAQERVIHEIAPPDHASFYFVMIDPHDGPCVIVSFDSEHKRNGRMDFRHRIDLDSGELELICPWV